MIIQRKFEQNVYGVPVYSCVKESQSGRVLSHGYVVGISNRFIRHWKSVVAAAKRQSEKK